MGFDLRKTAISAAVQIKRILQGNYNQSRYTKYIESIEKLPREQLREIQAEKLSVMAKHAVSKVPFYKELEGELELSRKTIFNDILSFPYVTKQMLHDNPSDFTAAGSPYIQKLYSGGTTMLKVTVLRDKSSLNFRNDEYFNRMAGIYPGISRLILSRPEFTYYEGNTNWPTSSSNDLTKTYVVSSVKYNREKFEIARKFYLDKNPKILKGNSTLLYEFACEMEAEGIAPRNNKIIFCSECTMQPEYLEAFKRVFNARVHDVYGATETNIVAAQCKEGKGLHYVPSSHFIEIVDSEGNEVSDGETGELQTTSLWHFAMPIIRYRIGDLATKTEEYCTCERTFPMLAKINGRTMEVIRTSGKGLLGLGDFRFVFKEYPEIIDFQAVQLGENTIRLDLITKSGRLPLETEKEITIKISEYVETPLKISFDYIKKLPKLHNGKVIRVVPLR